MSTAQRLFEGEREFLTDAQTNMTPAQYSNAIGSYLESAGRKVLDATSAEIIEELRAPSTAFPAIQAKIQNEALARIMEVCAL